MSFGTADFPKSSVYNPNFFPMPSILEMTKLHYKLIFLKWSLKFQLTFIGNVEGGLPALRKIQKAPGNYAAMVIVLLTALTGDFNSLSPEHHRVFRMMQYEPSARESGT